VSGGSNSLFEQLSAAPEKATYERLLAYLRECVSAALRMGSEEVALDVSLVQLGLDSLMAVEVRNRVERALGPLLPLARYLDGSNVETLTRAMLGELQVRAESAASAADEQALLDLLPQMTDEEVEVHLARLTQDAGA
jgi:hypothetical protein